MTTQTTLMLTDTEDDAVYCACGRSLTDAELDELGQQCTTCFAKEHFTCRDCGDTYANDEAGKKSKTRCETCQESKDEAAEIEQIDALKDEASELLENLCLDGDLAILKKAVAALKRLKAA
jgi:hypothetical protein